MRRCSPSSPPWPLPAAPARADPQEVETGEPLLIEDATTDDPGNLSIQLSGIYAHQHRDGALDLTSQGLTVKMGLVKGVQVSLNPEYGMGTAQGRNGGSVLGEALFQFNDQSRFVPAFAFNLSYATPYGAGPKSGEYTFRAIATKWLGATEESPRLNLNLTDYHVTQPDGGDRRDQLQAVLGGSVLLSRQGALIADIEYGAAEAAGTTETFLEIGYSRDLPGDWDFQIGVGKQVAGAGSGTRFYISIDKELKIF
ncbi:MAG: hypothetical protein WDN04_11200 [Rhodospirillales bacterium]